jgi:hypothetical protein
MSEKLKFKEIAERINDHLKRFEADPTIDQRNGGRLRFYRAGAYTCGSYIAIVYISYQGRSTLRRDAALAYLAYLDAGNTGRHWVQQRQQREALK